MQRLKPKRFTKQQQQDGSQNAPKKPSFLASRKDMAANFQKNLQKRLKGTRLPIASPKVSALRKLKTIEEKVKAVINPAFLGRKESDQLYLRWLQTVRKLLPLGGASEGNKLTLYSDGAEAFPAMWKAIEGAKERVWLETYILEAGAVADQTIKVLVDAANRGVDVKLIYDFVGSQKLKSSYLDKLKAAGGQVIAFNPFTSFGARFHLWFFRNHKKILVVDQNLAFTGGMNIGDQYAGPAVGGNGFFRDAHAKVEGPAARDLAKRFISSLEEAGYPIDDLYDRPPVTPLTRWRAKKGDEYVEVEECQHVDPASSTGGFVQILESNVRRNRTHIQRALNVAISASTKNCYLTTPYFLPPQHLKTALIEAAQRGVDVRILTAGISDVPVLQLATKHIYELLIRNGVKIYELYGQALHAKTAAIDSTYSSIGSFNLDTWSYYYNLEINLTTLDKEFSRKVEEEFLADLQRSKEVTLLDLDSRNLLFRFLHWAVYHMLRVFSWNYFPFKVKQLRAKEE